MFDISFSVNLTTFNDYENINQIVHLTSTVTNKKIILRDDEVVVSKKLAEINHIKVGDHIKLLNYEKKEYLLKVTDICNSYLGHHIFLNKNTYEKYIGTYSNNFAYLKVDKDKEKEVVKDLLSKDDILSVVNISYMKQTVSNMLESLNNIVIILIIFSGILSFVVLYNLSYINISERKREIASLKVLGFYHHEVDNYIIKENFIITIIGIIIGISIGKYFVNYIVDSIEVDMVKFIHQIDLLSYIKTCLFMLGFTIIVNIIIHFRLKKIDMIESLKSVE